VLLFNCSKDRPTASQDLRQAINYAIDKNALIKGAYGGVGTVAKTYGNNVYGDYVKAWDTQDYYAFNAAKAKELIAKSGYKDQVLTIMTGPVAAHKTMAQIIQAQLTEVGVKSKIVSYEDSLFNNYINDPTQWDVMVTNKGSGDFVASTWRFSFDSRMFKGATRGFLVDPKLQSLLEKCLDESTHTAENMDAFHQYLKQVAVGTGLLYSKYGYVYVNTMKSLVINTKNMIIPGSCTYADNFVSK
jgi:peptide/nickel transport system substrate-binding protein